MAITHCKPQQQTLSIRVSESLRDFLELSRQVIANDREEPVSISDIAKLLLESAKTDRLDFRLDVAGLDPATMGPTRKFARQSSSTNGGMESQLLGRIGGIARRRLSAGRDEAIDSKT